MALNPLNSSNLEQLALKGLINENQNEWRRQMSLYRRRNEQLAIVAD